MGIKLMITCFIVCISLLTSIFYGSLVIYEKKYFQNKVFQTIIPRNIRLSEAPSHGKPILLYDAKSKGAEVYLELAKEVISHG
ncbi:partition protein, ParA family [Listeria fleischmannii subsp. coloradonensis]|nr:partition protein, ParA family [Listeria fleischmannii subsp. coloradonensis]